MFRRAGYICVTSPDGVVEADAFTCKHCNAIVRVEARQRPEDVGGLCKQCMGLICPRCGARGNCDPLEKKLARAEARDTALRSYGL